MVKRLHTGLIIIEPIDIVCLSFSIGSGISWLLKIYLSKKEEVCRGEDPIIIELKRKKGDDAIVSQLKKTCPVVPIGIDGKPLLTVPTTRIRGGKIISLAMKNKRLSQLLAALLEAKKTQRQLKLLQMMFFVMNTVLVNSLGIGVAVGVSGFWVQILIISFPSGVAGFFLGHLLKHHLIGVLLPLAILYGRGVEDVPNPYENCQILCKAAEQFHNRQLAIEMKDLNSAVKNEPIALQLTPDETPDGPFTCVEEKLSLVERYRLRTAVENAKTRRRVQHFSEFIKKFPECDVDPELVYEEVVGKIPA